MLREILLVGAARVGSESEVVFSASVVGFFDVVDVDSDEVDEEEVDGRVWVWKLLVVESLLLADEVNVG